MRACSSNNAAVAWAAGRGDALGAGPTVARFPCLGVTERGYGRSQSIGLLSNTGRDEA